MTDVTPQVAVGTATEVRTFNDLNQLLTNAVTPVGGGTTNWTYTWNLDGTLATKFDGTNTYSYTWDPGGDQRLLSMALNGVTQVAYSYDSMGRMLTRTPYSAGVAGTPTNFEWDGASVVREFAPAGTYRYYAPQGELITFDYTPTAGATSTYCLHSDALGSVRMITDSTGASVAHYEFDAFGNLLASSSDISFGFNYMYVGSYGARWDATLGMYYMRQRWYSPDLGRFISRDPIGLNGGANLYSYVASSPTNFVDPSGLLTIGEAGSFLSRMAGTPLAQGLARAGAVAGELTPALPIVVTAGGILAASIRDGMRPAPVAPGAGRGPFFGDTAGEDRWGNRVYHSEMDPDFVPPPKNTARIGAQSQNPGKPPQPEKNPPGSKENPHEKPCFEQEVCHLKEKLPVKDSPIGSLRVNCLYYCPKARQWVFFEGISPCPIIFPWPKL